MQVFFQTFLCEFCTFSGVQIQCFQHFEGQRLIHAIRSFLYAVAGTTDCSDSKALSTICRGSVSRCFLSQHAFSSFVGSPKIWPGGPFFPFSGHKKLLRLLCKHLQKSLIPMLFRYNGCPLCFFESHKDLPVV